MNQKGNFFLIDTHKHTFEITSAGLHMLAMAFMLSDHMWATFGMRWDWMTCIGRIAFPIFAFMAVEGYFYTSNFRRYMLRMLAFALVSEIPFNLMYGGSLFYPVHQNVLWTFLISLACIRMMEAVKAKGQTWVFYVSSFFIIILGWLLGTVGMVDYYGAGIWVVLTFYFFHGRKWWCLVGQILALFWLNMNLGGLSYSFQLFGMSLEIPQQEFAMLALIPIWLYRGRQGLHNKVFQYACYLFYPVHCLVLVAISRRL